jgi:hypothetical protein
MDKQLRTGVIFLSPSSQVGLLIAAGLTVCHNARSTTFGKAKFLGTNPAAWSLQGGAASDRI